MQVSNAEICLIPNSTTDSINFLSNYYYLMRLVLDITDIRRTAVTKFAYIVLLCKLHKLVSIVTRLH